MRDENPDQPGIIAPPPLIYVAGLTMGLLLQFIFPVHVLPGLVASLLGLSLAGAGFFVAIGAFRVMKAAKTNVDPYQPATALVTDGPFRYTRNPLYVALTLLYGGIALLVNTPWPFLFLPIVLLIIRRGVIDREERYLEQKFGEAYTRYKESVPRWLKGFKG